MTDQLATPAPASHDPRVPTGVLEESAAALFEAMISAREGQERGDASALPAFYRALAAGTLLLPVPPGTQGQAHASLAAAATDQEDVEIGVMLARDGAGNAVSVVFASGAALAAWSPSGTGSIALPGHVVLQNLAASGLPAIVDPAGPIPYRFEPDELESLAAGIVPGTGEPLFGEPAATSIRIRLASTDTRELELALAAILRTSGVDAAYVVESATSGEWRTTVCLVADEEAGAAERLAAALEREQRDVDVMVLEEPMLTQVRGLTEPFHVRAGRAGR